MDLTQPFETHREHLRSVAYRMLGSLAEADDAVQEAWLRLHRSETTNIENIGGWLTTVVARVCLDMLRSRRSRREEPLDAQPLRRSDLDPEHEAVYADSVGLALLVVLDRLTPAERLAFVLHDMFGASFDEIAEITGRSPVAARQLASRARRRVHGASFVDRDIPRQREVVNAFLGALRRGDFDGLLAVLDPDVVVRAEGREIRGAANWAQGAIQFARAAAGSRAALVDGEVGIVLAPHGRLLRVLKFTFAGDKIAQVDVIADPERLARIEIGVLSRGAE